MADSSPARAAPPAKSRTAKTATAAARIALRVRPNGPPRSLPRFMSRLGAARGTAELLDDVGRLLDEVADLTARIGDEPCRLEVGEQLAYAAREIAVHPTRAERRG